LSPRNKLKPFKAKRQHKIKSSQTVFLFEGHCLLRIKMGCIWS